MAIAESKRIKEDNWFRFWISLVVFLLSFLFVEDQNSANLLPLIILFSAYTAFYGTAHLVAGLQKGGRRMIYGLVALDLAAITEAILLTGGVTSPFAILYLVVMAVLLMKEDRSLFVYGSVLSLLLYSGGLFWRRPSFDFSIDRVAGQLLLLAVLMGVLYILASRLIAKDAHREKLVSRAKTMARVADVLSGSLSNSRDWIRKISALIDDEVRKDGLHCRIIVHKGEQRFLPPSGSVDGVQIPVMVGECVFGTLIIAQKHKGAMGLEDVSFFSAIARSLGLSLHRAKLWEDFQTQLENMEASIWLNSFVFDDELYKTPRPHDEQKIIDNMLEMVRHERGKFKMVKEPCEFIPILKEEMDKAEKTASLRDIDMVVDGFLTPMPVFLADRLKLQHVVSNMFFNAAKFCPAGGEVRVGVSHQSGQLRLIVEATSKGLRSAKSGMVMGEARSTLPFEEIATSSGQILAFSICQKIIDAHGGRLDVEFFGPEAGTRFSFSIPTEKVALEVNT